MKRQVTVEGVWFDLDKAKKYLSRRRGESVLYRTETGRWVFCHHHLWKVAKLDQVALWVVENGYDETKMDDAALVREVARLNLDGNLRDL